MVIELVGLPGSGKTTFAKKLEKEGGWTRVRVTGAGEILRYNFLFVLFHPVSTFSQLVWFARYAGDRSLWYTKFMNLFLVHNAKFMKARSIDRAIVDQGHLQNIISLFGRAVEKERVASYVRILPKPDHALIFTVSSEIAEKRMKERGYGVREDVSPEERATWLASATIHVSMLPDMLPGHGIPADVLADDRSIEQALERFSKKTIIYYVHPTRMPTERAHGGQIARMISEWGALSARVTLVAGFRDQSCAGGDVATYYGVERNFATRFVAQHSLHERHKGYPKLAYFLNSLRIFWWLMWWCPEKGATIFTRRPEIAWLLKMKGYLTIYECHEWYAHAWRLPYFLGTHADLIVCINRYTAEEFAKRGFAKERLLTETNGVLYEAFALPITPSDARAKVELPSDKKIMLYTGGLKMMGEDKGVTTILESLRELAAPNILFVAVGGKPDEIAEFKDKAGTLGVLDKCLFIERKTRDELALYQRAADVLLIVHPRTHLFEYYMAPLKTFEYMASGRPIIASDLLSLREIMDDETAFWVSPGDSRDLAERVEEVLANPKEAERRAKNVQEKSRHFTWHARAERLLAKFQELHKS